MSYLRQIVLDIDGTLCPIKDKNQSYDQLTPYAEIVDKLREYKKNGFYIILYSARNMRSYHGNMGLITAITAKMTMEWLESHNVPYDEIFFGKPWCGTEGFYVDDKAIRPDEFLSLDYSNIRRIISAGDTTDESEQQ